LETNKNSLRETRSGSLPHAELHTAVARPCRKKACLSATYGHFHLEAKGSCVLGAAVASVASRGSELLGSRPAQSRANPSAQRKATAILAPAWRFSPGLGRCLAMRPVWAVTLFSPRMRPIAQWAFLACFLALLSFLPKSFGTTHIAGLMSGGGEGVYSK